MAERMSAALSPRAMQEVAETNWSLSASVARTEQHARRLFEQLVAPLRKSKDKQADFRAREWTVGALTAAFPRNERARVRPKMRELVERATGGAPNNRAFKVGDVVVIERFLAFQNVDKDRPIETRLSKIVRETPTRWVLESDKWIEKSTNIVRPAYIHYVDSARLA